MTLQVDLNPQTSAILTHAARKRGVDPAVLLESLVREHLPPVEEKPTTKISAKNAAAIAYLDQKLQEDATDDPEEIRKSEEEIAELTHNLNKNRIESGERPLFP